MDKGSTDDGDAPAATAPSRPQRDLTQGPITSTLIVFSLPVLGGNVLQSLNGSVNQFWVSHSLGVTAITAIGNANIIMMLLLGSIFGVAMAANILIAQAVGGGAMPMVKKVMGTAVVFFVALAAAVAVVGYFLAPYVLHLMGTPEDSKAEAIVYLRIVFLSMPFMSGFVFLQMAQRGAGDSRTPFYFLLLAIVLDIILNPLLILGVGPFPRMAIAGSAMSTFIGQGVSLACLVAWLYLRRSPLALRPSEFHHLKPDLAILNALVTRGLPMGMNMLVISSGAVVMIGMVNAYGAITAAAYTAATQVWTYLQMPSMALGAAVSSMVAQNIGAGRWDRVGRIAWSAMIIGLVVSAVIALVIVALGDLTLHIFLPAGSEALPVAHHINQIVIWSWVVMSITFIISGVMRATGAVIAPLVILIVSMWLVRLPLAHLMEPRFGPEAIWWSFPVSTAISSGLTLALYLHGGWRRSRLVRSQQDPSGHVPDVGMAAPVVDPHVAEDHGRRGFGRGRAGPWNRKRA
jgi:putative MATE family efflux protein